MLGASRARAYAALLFIGAGPILLGPIALSRYDYFPAFITVLAVALLLSGRERLACAVIGAGIVVKLYPAILLPIALIVLWRRYGRRGVLEGLGASLAVVAAGFLPFVVLAANGLWHGLWRQVQRPPEVESFVAALWIGAHHVAGLRLHSVQSFGSSNIATPGARLAGTLAGFLVIALVVDDLDPVRAQLRATATRSCSRAPRAWRRTSPSPRCCRRSTSSGCSRSCRSSGAGAASRRPSSSGSRRC